MRIYVASRFYVDFQNVCIGRGRTCFGAFCSGTDQIGCESFDNHCEDFHNFM